MKRFIFNGAAVLAVCLFSGCLEERVWWAPSGEMAVVSTGEGSFLATVDGKRSEILPTEQKGLRCQSVSWLRDGSGFVVQRTRKVASWGELKSQVSAKELHAIEELLPTIIPLLEVAIKRAPAGEGALEEITKGLHGKRSVRLLHALRLKHEQEPERMGKLLSALPQGESLLECFTGNSEGYELDELCLFKIADGRVVETRSLVRCLLDTVLLPRVSPLSGALAYVRLAEDGESASLEVMSLEGGADHMIARQVSGAFDWTPDGRALVFMAPLGGEGEKLQSIHRITVLDERGGLISERAAPTALATAVTLSHPMLQVLADGRVLFASQPVSLPAKGTGPELAPRLYLIAADGSAVTPVPTAPGDLPVNLSWFTASPDGRRVAVVESETDAVAVVEIDSGKMQLISPPHPHWQCRTMPAWKSAEELTFAALHDGAPAWMLWQVNGETRCLSANWPKSSTAKWLEHRSDTKAQPIRTTSDINR